MLCDRCKKNQATFHKSIYINGKGYETHLCGECAKLVKFEDNINFDTDFGFNNLDMEFNRLEKSLFNEFFNSDNFFAPTMFLEKNDKKCPKCNSTFNDFLRRGKLGCAQCYDTFEEEIRDMLENMDNPTDFNLDVIDTKKEISEIDKLNDKLKKAIAEERYEDAGELKNKINELRNKEDKGGK